ncbi:metallophosphoesterase [Streptomyces sp. LUP30]|uniref:metallophosphoesterase n=1 Tax=Streptomyces sp. LUP30 TaxID=1890285 RepID=UPI000851E456|nr:metallophosphoesterase [Streptomyces sp. LUP30]
MFVFAQLSDLHLGQNRTGDGGARAAERARRVLTYLDRLPGRLDAVLVSGDLADHGTDEEYEEFLALAGARAAGARDSRPPLLVCPGNHDVRAPFRRHLLPGDGADRDTPADRAHRLPGATFLMCDSSVPGEDHGVLTAETLDWLDRELTDDPRHVPAFVVLHHPPVPLSVPYVDEIRLRDEESFAALLRRHPRVVAVLCGHAHTAAATTFAGRPLLVAPGTVSTCALPWEGGEPVDYDLPPAVAFHVLADDHRLTTHFRVVP